MDDLWWFNYRNKGENLITETSQAQKYCEEECLDYLKILNPKVFIFLLN